MRKTYYLFNPGRMSRKDQTLKFTPVDEDGSEGAPKYIPVEGVSDLYCFGALDANSALYNFLGKAGISVHFFDYYEHYTGSFQPKEYLLAGKMQIQQTAHYLDRDRRLKIARKFVEGAAFNISKNLRYYMKRERKLDSHLLRIQSYASLIPAAADIAGLMGIEGNIRSCYYETFDAIVRDHSMEGRSMRPPLNELNSLISFGNMLCYTQCLDQIYHTQLNPTISYLHEPGYRRYSLALDIAEIFKPILVDRTIFRVLNKREVQSKDFDFQTNRVTLKETGKKAFVRAFEERLNETIKHRTLNKHVSYKHLIKLECYKLSKHLLDIETYHPFKIWW